DAIAAGGVEVNLAWDAVEVARRGLPPLPFPLVVVHPDHVAVGAGESRIDVDERLHDVVAGRNVAQAVDRKASIGVVDHSCRAWREFLHIAPEKRNAVYLADLESRLFAAIAGKDDEHAAGDRPAPNGRGEGDLESNRRPLCLGGQDTAQGGYDGQAHAEDHGSFPAANAATRTKKRMPS